MSTFQIGDRVRCFKEWLDSNMVLGMEGRVVTVPGDETQNGYGVDWDDLTTHHNCAGYARDGHGWYVRVQALELVEPEVIPNLEIGGLL